MEKKGGGGAHAIYIETDRQKYTLEEYGNAKSKMTCHNATNSSCRKPKKIEFFGQNRGKRK